MTCPGRTTAVIVTLIVAFVVAFMVTRAYGIGWWTWVLLGACALAGLAIKHRGEQT